MHEKIIVFKDLQDIREFVSAAEECDFDIDVCCNRTIVDAKSILGVIGFGLKTALKVRYGGDNENFENIVDKFVVA